MAVTPAAPPAAPSGTREVLALADGVELLGEYEDSGFREPPLLARRGDGQMVKLTPLLYHVAASCDGRRDAEQVAAVVTERFGRGVSADNVRQLAEQQLRPLGVLALADGTTPELPKRLALLALRHRRPLVRERAVNVLAAAFSWLHAQPGQGAPARRARCSSTPGCSASTASPAASAPCSTSPPGCSPCSCSIVVATAFHEIGHASACRFGGARPGVMGVGVYLVWPAFYCDVTEAYRLDRRGRLRTDLGGVYFNGIFALMAGAAYFATGHGGAAVRRLRAAPDRAPAAAAAAALRRLLRAQRPHGRAGHPLAHQADLPLARARPPQRAARRRAQALGPRRRHGLPARAGAAAGAHDRLDRACPRRACSRPPTTPSGSSSTACDGVARRRRDRRRRVPDRRARDAARRDVAQLSRSVRMAAARASRAGRAAACCAAASPSPASPRSPARRRSSGGPTATTSRSGRARRGTIGEAVAQRPGDPLRPAVVHARARAAATGPRRRCASAPRRPRRTGGDGEPREPGEPRQPTRPATTDFDEDGDGVPRGRRPGDRRASRARRRQPGRGRAGRDRDAAPPTSAPRPRRPARRRPRRPRPRRPSPTPTPTPTPPPTPTPTATADADRDGADGDRDAAPTAPRSRSPTPAPTAGARPPTPPPSRPHDHQRREQSHGSPGRSPAASTSVPPAASSRRSRARPTRRSRPPRPSRTRRSCSPSRSPSRAS